MKHKDEIEQVKKMLFENPSKSFQIMQENIPKYTMYGYMAKSNEDNGNNIALSFGKRKITYDEFLSMIDDYAKGFLSLGIKKGDRVALLLPNLPESTIIIYALNKIGAISDNIDPTTSCERIKYFLVTEGVSAIVCFDKIYEKLIKPIEPFIYEELKIDKILVPKVSDSLSLPEKIIYNFANRKNNIISSSYGKIDIINIPEFIENSKYQICYTNKYYPNEIATICHSSGTEGMPKTIPSTNENVNFISFQHEVSGIDYSKVKTFLHILPGFAQFGFSDSMHLGHVLGLEMIEVPIFSHEVILDMLVKTKANCIFSEPSLWIRLCEDEKYKNVDLSFLYEAVYGGGKLTVYQIARINQFLVEHNAKCLLRVGYGLSEFNGTCILENPFMSSVGSCGKDLIGGEGIILDEDTKKEVPNGQKGMLYYTKASMPVCEFDGKILHKPIEINGKNYIDTGDIMSKNDAGEYFFSTRASGMICRYDGYKVYPNVIEETLTATPYVEDCMVSEYYDEEKYGMMPIVYIIPSKQFNIDDSDKIIYEIIEQYILNNPNMTYRDIPKKWKIVSTLPVTSSLKKNYKKIKEIGIDGSEINVICAETNMGLDQIEISLPEKDKKLIRKLKK